MAERTQFMLQVAHNLRAPLSAGLSMMDLLEDGYMGEVTDKQAEYLKRIEDRLRSLDQTISELLTIARTRDWSHEIPDVVVDLEGLAAYTERPFEPRRPARICTSRVTTEPDLPKVDSGADLLEQVMENLVSNAIKYTPEGGAIEVRFGAATPRPSRSRSGTRESAFRPPNRTNCFRSSFGPPTPSASPPRHRTGPGAGQTDSRATQRRAAADEHRRPGNAR